MSVDCPLCRQPTSKTLPAVLADFLRVRCGIGEDVEATSHLCEVCEHVFFTPFLTPEQLSRLYAGYRSLDYNELRFAVEPSYRAVAPMFEDPDSDHDKARNEFYDFCLSSYKHFDGLVVDFGGGDGHFARRIFPSAPIQVVEEDFERSGGDLPALLMRTRMLFCAHVFEHLPQPGVALTGLVRFLQPGTRVWLEVPIDYAGNLTAAFDRARATGERGAVNLMHEHVAHYSRRSLRSLAHQAGLNVEEVIVSNRGLMAAVCHRA